MNCIAMAKEEDTKEQAAAASPLDANRYVIAAFLFILSFGVLYALGTMHQLFSGVSQLPILELFLPVPQMSSPMYFLMPVAGFFLIFFLVEWVNKFFNSRAGFLPILPALLLLLSMLAFYIAIFWYIGNYTQLAGRQLSIDEANRLFVGRFKASAYYLFVLAGILGWAARTSLEKIKL